MMMAVDTLATSVIRWFFTLKMGSFFLNACSTSEIKTVFVIHYMVIQYQMHTICFTERFLLKVVFLTPNKVNWHHWHAFQENTY